MVFSTMEHWKVPSASRHTLKFIPLLLQLRKAFRSPAIYSCLVNIESDWIKPWRLRLKVKPATCCPTSPFCHGKIWNIYFYTFKLRYACELDPDLFSQIIVVSWSWSELFEVYTTLTSALFMRILTKFHMPYKAELTWWLDLTKGPSIRSG